MKKTPLADFIRAAIFLAVAVTLCWLAFTYRPADIRIDSEPGMIFWSCLFVAIGLVIYSLAFGYRSFTGRRLLGLPIIG